MTTLGAVRLRFSHFYWFYTFYLGSHLLDSCFLFERMIDKSGKIIGSVFDKRKETVRKIYKKKSSFWLWFPHFPQDTVAVFTTWAVLLWWPWRWKVTVCRKPVKIHSKCALPWLACSSASLSIVCLLGGGSQLKQKCKSSSSPLPKRTTPLGVSWRSPRTFGGEAALITKKGER